MVHHYNLHNLPEGDVGWGMGMEADDLPCLRNALPLSPHHTFPVFPPIIVQGYVGVDGRDVILAGH